MKAGGYVALLIGVLVVVLAFFFDTTVGGFRGDRTHNLGLLQTQMMILQAGLGSAVVGSVLLAVGSLIEKIETSRKSDRAESGEETEEPAVVAGAESEDMARPGAFESAKARLRGGSPDDGAQI